MSGSSRVCSEFLSSTDTAGSTPSSSLKNRSCRRIRNKENILVLQGIDSHFSGASEILKSEFDLLEQESLERPDTETEEEGEDGLPDHDGDDPDRGWDLTGHLMRVGLSLYTHHCNYCVLRVEMRVDLLGVTEEQPEEGHDDYEVRLDYVLRVAEPLHPGGVLDAEHPVELYLLVHLHND